MRASTYGTSDWPKAGLQPEPTRESMGKLMQEMEYLQKRTVEIKELMRDQTEPGLTRSKSVRAIEQEELVRLKREHKKLEEDAQKVKNKIEMLKKNERRFLKNIHYYHSRAQEIERQKQINEQRRKEKQIIAERRKREAQLLSTKRKKDPDNVEAKLKELLFPPKPLSESEVEKRPSNIRLEAIKKHLERQKLERARELKLQKTKNEHYYKQQKEEMKETNKIRKFEVAKLESMAFLRLESHKREKKDKVLDRLRKEKSKEQFIIRSYQKDLGTLFQTHHEWVEKLKSRDAEEMQALEKYKKALDLEDEELQGFDEDKVDGEEANQEASYLNKDNGGGSQGSLSEDVNQSVQ